VISSKTLFLDEKREKWTYFSRRKRHDIAVKLSAMQNSDSAMGIVSGRVLDEAMWIG
jgi:hypothetical protein